MPEETRKLMASMVPVMIKKRAATPSTSTAPLAARLSVWLPPWPCFRQFVWDMRTCTSKQYAYKITAKVLLRDLYTQLGVCAEKLAMCLGTLCYYQSVLLALFFV